MENKRSPSFMPGWKQGEMCDVECLFMPLAEFANFMERFPILSSKVLSCSASSESVTFFEREVNILTRGRVHSPALMPLRLRFGLEPLYVMVAVFIVFSFLFVVGMCGPPTCESGQLFAEN